MQTKQRCTAATREGTRCKRQPCWGQNVCQKHGATIADRCIICDDPIVRNNLCNKHSLRYSRHGHPMDGRTGKGEPIAWLKSAIENRDRSECWEWPFSRRQYGHGELRESGRSRAAHQVAMELDGRHKTGTNDQGNHRCNNPPCVNPDHIYWGTPTENELDSVAAGTHTRGSRNGGAKLDAEDVRIIRASKLQRKHLAKVFAVSETAILRIQNKESYQDVT